MGQSDSQPDDVTPEMIEAGVAALLSGRPWLDAGDDYETSVKDIFLVMDACRPNAPCRSPSQS